MRKDKLKAYALAIIASYLAFSAIIVITMALLAEPFSFRSPGVISDSIAIIGVSLATWLGVFSFRKMI